MIKNYSTYNTVNENHRQVEILTLTNFAKNWRNLDQILVEADKKFKGKIIKFTQVKGNDVKIIFKSIYYKRFITENNKMGNNWFFVNQNNKEYQIAVNKQIIIYTKVNELDPWGEEDWDD